MKNKAYILSLIVIFVYIIIINPINKKEESEKEKDKKENDGKIESGETIAGFDYGDIDMDAYRDAIGGMSKTETISSGPTYTL